MEDSTPGRAHQVRQLAQKWRRAWCVTAARKCLVSAGNTGAVDATAQNVQGMVRGVTRPALAGIFPTGKTGYAGCGAGTLALNVRLLAAQLLAQFAVMGEIYSRVVLRRRGHGRRAFSQSARKSIRETT